MKNLFMLLFLLSLISCGKRPVNQDSSSHKPTILVSLAPYQLITEKIAGDSFLVQTVVPPGSNPHLYEPTIKQIKLIREGVIWFRIGESFEKQVLPVLKEKNPNLLDVDLRNGLILLHDSGCKCHAETLEDRHIWLSPKSLIKQVHTIVDHLGKKFPDQRKTFIENGDALIRDLENLDAEIKTVLEKAKHRSFLVSHPAFAYFCKDYDLTQLSIELGGKDPTPKHLTKIIQEAKASETKLALAMPQHSNKGLELIADKLKLNVSTIDPYSSDYFKTMRLLAHLVADNE